MAVVLSKVAVIAAVIGRLPKALVLVVLSTLITLKLLFSQSHGFLSLILSAAATLLTLVVREAFAQIVSSVRVVKVEVAGTYITAFEAGGVIWGLFSLVSVRTYCFHFQRSLAVFCFSFLFLASFRRLILLIPSFKV